MDWIGSDTHNMANVFTMEECQNWCREKNSKNFVWVRRDNRCVCKDVETGKNSDTCCISGHATECMGKLFVQFSEVKLPTGSQVIVVKNFMLCNISPVP